MLSIVPRSDPAPAIERMELPRSDPAPAIERIELCRSDRAPLHSTRSTQSAIADVRG